MTQQNKKCSKCKNIKPIVDFSIYKSGKNKGYYSPHCKKCENIRTRKWRNSHKERMYELRKI